MTARVPETPRPARQETLAPSAELERRGLGGERLAFGLAGVGGAWGPVEPSIGREAIQRALERGVRVFDAAPSYGTAEKLLGQVLAGWRGPRPIISTKIGRLATPGIHEHRFDFSRQGMRDSLRRSLEVIGVPRLDLLFLHEPDFVPLGERAEVTAILRELQADGLVGCLGLGGGFGAGWDGLVESGAFAVAMLFRRVDACVFDGLADDLPRLRRARMATYGASPLHMGLLGSRHEEFVRGRPGWVQPEAIERALRLKDLAARVGLSLPTLAHRFAFSLAAIDRVVIGARSAAELDDACAAFQAGPLPAEWFDAVCALHAPPTPR